MKLLAFLMSVNIGYGTFNILEDNPLLNVSNYLKGIFLAQKILHFSYSFLFLLL